MELGAVTVQKSGRNRLASGSQPFVQNLFEPTANQKKCEETESEATR
jgi:hypothetical protein